MWGGVYIRVVDMLGCVGVTISCYSYALNQCWSESGLVSPAVSPSPLDQSLSPSPSPLDQSPSPSPVGQSPSPSPRVQQKSEWVRTQPGLVSPTIEKCFILTLLLIILTLLLIIFAEPCIDNW